MGCCPDRHKKVRHFQDAGLPLRSLFAKRLSLTATNSQFFLTALELLPEGLDFFIGFFRSHLAIGLQSTNDSDPIGKFLQVCVKNQVLRLDLSVVAAAWIEKVSFVYHYISPGLKVFPLD
jgi:hypothetical protein